VADRGEDGADHRTGDSGHSRSTLWCGSQNHHSDLSPGYGRLLRNFETAQAAITFNCTSFPTCYGIQFAEQPRNRNTILVGHVSHCGDRTVRSDMFGPAISMVTRLSAPAPATP